MRPIEIKCESFDQIDLNLLAVRNHVPDLSIASNERIRHLLEMYLSSENVALDSPAIYHLLRGFREWLYEKQFA